MNNEEIDDMDFSTGDAGSSATFPMQCSSLRKSGVVMIKGNPCKIVNMSTSKTGKHGHAKVHITALDIFNGKKYEDICPSTHNMDVPHVTRKDYAVSCVDDGYLSLMDEGGNIRDDLKLPDNQDLANEITNSVDEGKDILVSVLSACGREAVVGIKVNTAAEKLANAS